jgi:hypothetical protein
MNELTAPKLKAAVESQEFLGITSRLYEAMALAKLIRQKVYAYEIPLFQSLGFKEDKHGNNPSKPIEDPKYAYLSDDDELFREFVVLSHKKHVENGFDYKPITDDEATAYILDNIVPGNPRFGKNPALIAEYAQIKIEQLLLEYMEKTIGMPHSSRIEDREKILESCLKMAAYHLEAKGDRVTVTA